MVPFLRRERRRRLMFRKFTGENIENICDYVKDFLKDVPNVEVIVGTDSQNYGDHTNFSTVIAMYEVGHGAHCVYEKWRTPRERIRQNRLLKEVEASIKTADVLKAGGIKIKYIDIDINCSPRFKSNEVFSTAKGWVEGSGYECRWKTLGPLITTMADYVVKR